MRLASDIIEYVSLLRDITMTEFYGRFPRGYDDSPPLNLSRYLWLMSGQSQQTYEASVRTWGKN